MLLSSNAAKFRSALSLLFERACLVSRSPAPFEIISSNQAHRNCELSASNLIQLPICFRYSLGLFYMFAEPHQWAPMGCVYSQSIYTGKLDYNPQMAAAGHSSRQREKAYDIRLALGRRPTRFSIPGG
jgi:hypothetical protein